VKILAIETSTVLGGLAVTDDDSLIAESRLNVRVTHSERLLGEIDHILKRSSLVIGDIDVFGISIGPGSFTGLRVGLSTVKGLAFATGRPVVAVPTLEAFAWHLPFCIHHVCPLLDARRGEVYAAVFEWRRDRFIRRIGECALPVEALIPQVSDSTVFLGEGAIRYREALERLGDRARFGHVHHMVPSPAAVALLSRKKALRSDFEDPVTLSPFYIRRSEAEIKSGDGP
jgi:tRNA threonylcarbamoyladenosine biosynthesis protein TsaB